MEASSDYTHCNACLGRLHWELGLFQKTPPPQHHREQWNHASTKCHRKLRSHQQHQLARHPAICEAGQKRPIALQTHLIWNCVDPAIVLWVALGGYWGRQVHHPTESLQPSKSLATHPPCKYRPGVQSFWVLTRIWKSIITACAQRIGTGETYLSTQTLSDLQVFLYSEWRRRDVTTSSPIDRC